MLDIFALVADAVAVIRFGFSDLSDVRRRLTDQLLADAGNRDLGERRAFKLDSFGSSDFDGMRIADVEDEFVPLRLRLPNTPVRTKAKAANTKTPSRRP